MQESGSDSAISAGEDQGLLPASGRRGGVQALGLIGLLLVMALAVWAALHWRTAGLPGKAAGDGLTVSLPASATNPPPKVEPVHYIALPAEQAKSINAAIPFSTERLVPARSYRFTGEAEERARAVDCLAAAAFYEAGTDHAGQLSVMQVVLNRMRHPAFPKTVCAVVFQGEERATGCQFSFTCDGSMDRRHPTEIMWRDARKAADAMLSGTVDPLVGLATHYHTDWVVPVWSSSLTKIAKVGTHLFFRWPGWWGTAPAFTGHNAGVEERVAKMVALSPDHRAALPHDLVMEGDETVSLPSQAQLAAVTATTFIEPSNLKPDLRGNRVVRTSADGKLYLVSLNQNAYPGTYAMTALSLCRDKVDCRVVGWMGGEAVPEDSKALQAGMASAAFVYERNGRGGHDGARWDCRRFQQAEAGQCL